MAQVLISEEHLSDIAQAIRVKKRSSDTYTPGQMGDAIRSIPTVYPTLIPKSITANGSYDPASDSADGYSSVAVNVPNSYSASDEGKVVENAALVSQTSKNINANGTHDTTKNNSVVVNVPNSYSAGDEGKVVDNGALVAQTSKNINANGTHDTTKNNSVVVSVPNSYSQSDEGKVVDNGALVAQTSQTITQNGTYDTTLKDEVVVNVAGGGGGEPDGVPRIIDDAIEMIIARNDGRFDENKGIYLAGDRSIDYDLGADNTSFTAYLVGKSIPTSGAKRILIAKYAESSSNGPCFFRSGANLCTSTLNNDTNTGISANNTYILALKVDATAKKVAYFINGSNVGEKSFSNSGRYLKLGGDDSWYETMYAYYFAVVPSAQSEEDILVNLAKINDYFIYGQPQECNGKNIFSGSDIPSIGLGRNGDMYLQYSNVPREYTRLDYIESHGTEYIDTGLYARPQYKTIMDMQVVGTGDQTYLGGDGGTTSVLYLGANPQSAAYTCFYYNWGGSPAWNLANYTCDYDRHIMESSIMSNRQVTKKDGVILKSATNSIGSSSLTPLNIFRRSDDICYAIGKVFDLKIYDYISDEHGVLVRHFVPAKRNSDDEVGLYDLVNGVFYTNSGTGAFTYGAEADIGEVMATYCKVNGAWQELDGTSIDLVNTDSNNVVPTYRAWHIWTRTHVSGDASMYVQAGKYDLINANPFTPTGEADVVYFPDSTYRETQFGDLFKLASYVDSGLNWGVIATKDLYSTLDGYKADDARVHTWYYSTAVDFYVLEYVEEEHTIYPPLEAYFNGNLGELFSNLVLQGTSYPDDLSQGVLTFMNTYAKDRYGTKQDGSSMVSSVTLTDEIARGSLDSFKAQFGVLTQAEYEGYVTSAMISALGLVELGRDMASGSAITLSDSIENYSAILAQGVYKGQETSEYNTTMMYINPQLNTQYWAGMKDRNSGYDRYFTFTSNTQVSLSGGNSSRGIIIYGLP